MNLNFQSCHIYDNLVDSKLNGNPHKKESSDSSYAWLKTINAVIKRVPKSHIRVTLSFETLVQFQCLICEINGYFMPDWLVYSDLLGTF